MPSEQTFRQLLLSILALWRGRSQKEIAAASGAYTVEVNPEETTLTNICDDILRGKAGEILPLF